nr:polyketide synthase dehydratase domain-containing protein [Bacillus velezensis]
MMNVTSIFGKTGSCMGALFSRFNVYGAAERKRLHTYSSPKEAAYALENYTLHPSLIDGALQSLFGITDGREEASVYVPFSIEEITIRKKVLAECWAYARKTGQKGQSELIYDIQSLNEHGERLAGLKDVTIRKKETFSAETQTRATADSNGKNERVKELLRQLKAGELTAEEADYALERMQD